MKKIISLLTATALTTAVWGQSLEGVKHSVGGSFNIHNYQMPISWNADPVNAQFTGVDFLYGYSFSPSMGLRVPIGLGVVNYPTIENKKVTAESLRNYAQAELDFMYRIKPGAAISPYILTGIGAQTQNTITDLKSTNYLDAYVPAGIGLNFRVNEFWKIFIEGDYRKSLTTKTDNILGRIGAIYLIEPQKDTDGDGIIDKEDACPEVKGLAEFKGCPDTDGDGIIDKDDTCPTEKGSAEMKGCPDKDGDKVADKDDACPEVAGLAALNGCPDKDGDGVADKDDTCPDVAGLAALKGCPDTDGDGIADADDSCPAIKGSAAFKGCPDSDGDGIEDKNDACPTTAGIAAFNGCPDTDGDGIEDKNDKCPTVAGVKENNGCPKVAAPTVTDRDGDGIDDKDDACPDTKGSAAFKGCPDTDGDGIADKDDKCPTEAGVKENFGCPAKKEVVFTFDNILFETGKATIKTESFAVLDKVVTILKENPRHLASIAGHTDSQGKPASNQTLSENRAKSCLDYLVSKGIGKDRLSSLGLGDKVPVGDNKTPEGRLQNRRVEFKLSLPK